MDSSDPPERTGPALQSRPDSARLPHWITVLLLLGACVAARLWCLVCKPFWFDEAYSVELARIDWRNFAHLLWWREANMSLYYLLLRGWMHLGQSPFFIRTLSVIFSAATLPAVYWLARLLFNRRVAIIAASLFAFSAYSVRYSQEARSYALFLLLTTLSSALLIAWIRQPTRFRRMGYIVVSVLAVYAHFYALLLIGAQWLALRLKPSAPEQGREGAPEMRRTWLTIGIAVLPLLVFVAKTGAGPIKWIQRPGIHDLLRFFQQLAGGTSWILLVVYAAGCVAAVAPVRKKLLAHAASWDAWRCQFLLVWLLLPVVLTVVLSFARPVFLPRYLIFILPALIVLMAAGLARLRRAWLLGPVLAVVLLLNAGGIRYVYGHDFDTERDASGEATNFILDHAQPGDGIILHIAGTRAAYEFFRSLRAGENTASARYGGNLGPEIIFPRHGEGMDYRDFTGKPAPEIVSGAGSTHRRVWVMLMNNGPAGNPDPTTYMLIDHLRRDFAEVEVWDFARVDVRLYSRE